MCIFSYDGTNRIRFTGQGKYPNLSRFHRHPEDGFVMRSALYYIQRENFVKSQHLTHILQSLFRFLLAFPNPVW